MPAIGGISFVTLKGGIQDFGEMVQTITRPGVDGVGFRKTGQRSDPFVLASMVDYSSAAAAQTGYESYKDKQGTLVSITDELGVSHSNFMVHKVERVSCRYAKVIGGVGSGFRYVLRCKWTLQAAGDPTAVEE